MTISITEVNQAIMFGDFTDEQLRSIGMAVTYRRNQILSANKRQLAVGSKVKFVGRQGRTVIGSVEKINRKFIIVKEQPNSFNGGIFATNWRVPGNMLELV
jgi:transcription elongation factor